MDFKAQLKKALKAYGEDIPLEVPPYQRFGDYAFPCFGLAKTQNKNPAEIAETIKNELQNLEFIDKIETKGPYVNFFIKKEALVAPTQLKLFKDLHSLKQSEPIRSLTGSYLQNGWARPRDTYP